MRRTAILIAIALTFSQLLVNPVATLAASDKASGKYAEKIQEFEKYAAQQLKSDRVPGMTIGFIKDDFVWVKGFGYADLENQSPAKPESAYRLASVTKPMTAAAVLQLVEKGKIDLDAEVQKYVPYFPKKKWPVTVRQLLGHLGGISHYKNPNAELHIKEHRNTRESIAIFENFDLVAEPGARYNYSSYGYNLLGAIIEGASGQSYADYMRENIWKPLGMNDTRMDDPAELIQNRVRGYSLVGGKIVNSEFIDISSRFAAGGTRSTVPDMLKFAKGIMSGKLLSKAMLDLMCTPMTTRDGRSTGYGLGWGIESPNGRFLIAHSGGQQETRTLLFIFPTENLAVAAAINFENEGPNFYVRRLFELVSGEPFDLSVYTGSRWNDTVYSGMKEVFAEGLSYFSVHRKSLAETSEENAQAFAYFNENVNAEAIKANPQEIVKKIRDGSHPAAGRPFVKAGSFMAMKLLEKHGPERLKRYTSVGALAFFNDYMEMYKSDPNSAKQFRFNDAFEKTVLDWSASWNRTNTDYVRNLSISNAENPDAVCGELKKVFNGASAYPSFVDDFVAMIRLKTLGGNKEKALKIGQAAVELYPEAEPLIGFYGVSRTYFDDKEGAMPLFKKALAINPNGVASAGSLNGIAYQLVGIGKAKEGLKLLMAAVELHPTTANLYDSIGEFHLNKGDKEKAIAFYRKALEIDPNLATSKAALEKIGK